MMYDQETQRRLEILRAIPGWNEFVAQSLASEHVAIAIKELSLATVALGGEDKKIGKAIRMLETIKIELEKNHA